MALNGRRLLGEEGGGGQGSEACSSSPGPGAHMGRSSAKAFSGGSKAALCELYCLINRQSVGPISQIRKLRGREVTWSAHVTPSLRGQWASKAGLIPESGLLSEGRGTRGSLSHFPKELAQILAWIFTILSLVVVSCCEGFL